MASNLINLKRELKYYIIYNIEVRYEKENGEQYNIYLSYLLKIKGSDLDEKS
jgi:hypothetical protein